ncbi:hypothetical protein G7067_08275 [Leucobacter insecticola]|uniref:Uncharacterized protein n=1 Tax=Leucobacter insecticola TaxID=2714934 RepID=A0A6G8FJ65_9MICO|nr:DUF6704 family protein [Leucobacter insecticola]QIM16417.1 hypothetical protein G7067_08275 [Leucobacter insecticola]
MTSQHEEPGHGDSPAAWTAVVVMLIGIAAGAVFFFLNMPTLVWVCVGVVALGIILGFVLSKAGYGVNGPKYSPKTHD